MPVLDDANQNIYYFPPFEDNGIMKIAALSSGYTIKGEPRTQSDYPDDGIPKEAEEHLRRGMRASIPSLAEKEMFDTRVCWDVQTPDEHYLISPHPDVSALYLATGGTSPPPKSGVDGVGSGHGFKFLPRIGYYIALMLEGTLPAEFADKWKWRPGQKWREHPHTERTLEGKDFEETERWANSAHHGPMAHTWGNPPGSAL
jgi:sarcosine oxidase/L-pipecolate oxidase